MKRVSVRIDRLVLRGFPRGDGAAIARGLEQELGRVLSDARVVHDLAASGDTPRLRAPRAAIEPGSHPLRIGAGVAQAIGKGLKS